MKYGFIKILINDYEWLSYLITISLNILVFSWVLVLTTLKLQVVLSSPSMLDVVLLIGLVFALIYVLCQTFMLMWDTWQFSMTLVITSTLVCAGLISVVFQIMSSK
jgi:hypothetical protein